MLALQVMLSIYAIVLVIAVINALVAPALQRWLIRHGARDPQWFLLGDEPPAFKQFRAELRASHGDQR